LNNCIDEAQSKIIFDAYYTLLRWRWVRWTWRFSL